MSENANLSKQPLQKFADVELIDMYEMFDKKVKELDL